MMNKKRLAALAMSAVMAAGTVSIPVNAADFSDGAAVQEEVAVQSVDVTEDVVDAAGEITITNATWGTDLSTPSLTVTVNGEKETYTTGFEKKEIPATCTTKGGYKWYIKIYDEPFLSDLVETTDALGHQLEEYTKEEPVASCEFGGTLNTYEKCTREGCDYEKLVKTETILAKGHTIDRDAETTKVEYRVSVDPSAGVGNTKLDANGKVVLDNPTKDGTYGETVTGICTVCGEEVTNPEEIKTLKATMTVEGTSKVTYVSDNIASDIEGKDPKDASFPKNDEIVLKDCSKGAYYIVTVYSSNNTDDNEEIIDTIRVDVKAHHVMGEISIKYVNDADEALCTKVENNDGSITVVNNSCKKDVKYYEVKTCVAEGCKHVEKTEKTAAKSNRHSTIQTSLEEAIEGLKDKNDTNDTVDYDDLLKVVNGLGKNGKYAKVVNVTATCNKNGTADVELYCQVCGEKAATISGVKVSMEHKFVYKSENKVAATCQSTGSYDSVYVCERCGKEESRKTITIPRLLHTNETKDENDKIVNDESKIGKSEASIKFIGSLVFGSGRDKDGEDVTYDYHVGDEFHGGANYVDKNGNVITSGIVETAIITDCAVCHNHQVKLTVTPEVKVKAITKETVDVVTEKVIAPGSITLVATYEEEGGQTLTKEITLPYYSEATDTTVGYTGLHKDVDGVYRYYVNGEFDEDYSGIVDFDGGQYVVANGVLCKDASGLTPIGDEWYLLTEGRIRTEVTQLVEYDGEWFFVANGKLDTSVNDLVEYDGETFVFVDGRLAQEGNGLWIGEEGVWYFLSNGRVAEEHTGLAMYDDEWFYVVEGKLAVDYSGTVEFEGGTFKVDHGMVKGQVK